MGLGPGLAGLLLYQNFTAETTLPNPSNNEKKSELPPDQKEFSLPRQSSQIQEIKTEGIKSGGTLNVCLDQCGDGICQKTDQNCKEGNLNCLCPETLVNCPQDCSDKDG